MVALAGVYFGFNFSDIGDAADSVASSYKPELPITVSYRKSMLGKGYVAIIENTSIDDLQVVIDLRDPEAANKKKENTTLIKGQPISIGWVEGWEFKLGDIVKISNPEYRVGVYAIK